MTHFDGGREALAFIERSTREVDLVLLDMVMPDMNGRETFGRLRAVRPGLKVLLSSGYSMNGDMEKVLEEGAAGFVQKPYHRNELAQAIMSALGLTSGGTASPSGGAAGPSKG